MKGKLSLVLSYLLRLLLTFSGVLALLLLIAGGIIFCNAFAIPPAIGFVAAGCIWVSFLVMIIKRYLDSALSKCNSEPKRDLDSDPSN